MGLKRADSASKITYDVKAASVWTRGLQYLANLGGAGPMKRRKWLFLQKGSALDNFFFWIFDGEELPQVFLAFCHFGLFLAFFWPFLADFSIF